jgi:phosphatidylserine/phosphatidylglycerophosphate/cardiolipin synthase-like enzyme
MLTGRPTSLKLRRDKSQGRLKNPPGPKVFLYPHMSHAKVIMTDDRIVAIGSANLTPRSMLTSNENTLFIQGVSTSHYIRKLREQIETDIAASEAVVNPFTLSPLEEAKAVVGKYVC